MYCLKNNASKKVFSIIASLIILMGIFMPSLVDAAPNVVKGTVLINAEELPDLLDTPKSSIRFALWNGSMWFELPYTINDTSAQKVQVLNAQLNETEERTISTASVNVTKVDVFFSDCSRYSGFKCLF
jgi:hypothetical protein